MKSGSPISKQYFKQGFVAAAQRYYYVRDHQGSVRQLIDDAGRVRAQYDYDPYGNVTKKRGDVDSDERYAGYFQHAPSGFAFALYRAYDPVHARWLNRDPIGEAGGLNLYSYVDGDPVNWVDPLGTDPAHAAAGAVIGADIGFALGGGTGVAVAICSGPAAPVALGATPELAVAGAAAGAVVGAADRLVISAHRG